MRLLVVAQRYGVDVVGGAEAFARELAGRLRARGHDVEVATSRAAGYLDWADVLPEEECIAGVPVHRFGVIRPRDLGVFGPLNGRVQAHPEDAAPHVQREWMRLQGPWLRGFEPWVAEHSRGCDAAIVVTYLYWTAQAALRVAGCPTILHPTAHDEPPSRIPLFDLVYRRASAFGFLTEEEGEFVRDRYRVQRPSTVTGIGIDVDRIRAADPAPFRGTHRLEDRPYLACVGRVDSSKNVEELLAWFSAFKRRHPGPLALALIGEEVTPVARRPDVVVTGQVDDATRDQGVAGAEALVQPSLYESFSLSLCEAWAGAIPALVQGRTPVLRGHALRSGGAIPYVGYAEFEAGLEVLLTDPDLRRRMGEAGRSYVEQRFRWEVILDRYERFLERVCGAADGRSYTARPA